MPLLGTYADGRRYFGCDRDHAAMGEIVRLCAQVAPSYVIARPSRLDVLTRPETP